MTRRIDSLSQRRLAEELRRTVDAVRITDPLRGSSPAARQRLRQLIRDNPHSIQSPHVRYNIGRARREWLEPLIKAELQAQDD